MRNIRLQDLLPRIEGTVYIDSDYTSNCLAYIKDGQFKQTDCYTKEILLLAYVIDVEAFSNGEAYIRINVAI